MFVEATRMGGEGKITLTGQLGRLNTSSLRSREDYSLMSQMNCQCLRVVTHCETGETSRTKPQHIRLDLKTRRPFRKNKSSATCFHSMKAIYSAQCCKYDSNFMSIFRRRHERVRAVGVKLAEESLSWGEWSLLVLLWQHVTIRKVIAIVFSMVSIFMTESELIYESSHKASETNCVLNQVMCMRP